ncbi:MAG: hypothetical protein GXP42_04255 [Chloroflexi bacterium]|nr:hypothetical protein [Chloroflexota bacterium]
MYGFVQPSGAGNFTERTIRIERLGAAKKDESIENVLVAWVAPLTNKGVFLVGWYSNAIVYRKYQTPPKGAGRVFKDVEIGYYVKARESDCILLPEEERTLTVPKAKNQMGGLGQSLVWYADSGQTNDRLFRRDLLTFIELYEHQRLENELNETRFTMHRFVEGAPRRVTSTTYERNRKARDICINYYGARCSVCGFDFLDFYGKIGKDYIQVHHVKPLSDVGQEYEIDPLQDLRPVCPNCHAMIHRRNPPYTIEEIKAFIQKRGS